jgi:drug/metabolite transporter (DMT)-like permease
VSQPQVSALLHAVAFVLLLGVTAVWGWTFVLVADAVAQWGVLAFLAVRFALAAVLMAAVWGRRIDRGSLAAGWLPGAVLAAAYLLQTWGLRHTTPTNAGLITGLFVVIAPVLDRIWYGTHMRRVAWIAVGCSLIGMSLLSGRGPTNLAFGDLLMLGCAFGFGAHIALLSRRAPHHDTGALTTVQMVVTAGLFVLFWPAVDPVELPPPGVWPAILICGVLASAAAYGIQTWAQRHLSTAQTAVILTMEPVFAAVFGYLLAGDRLSAIQLAGGALILTALTLTQVLPFLRTPRVPASDASS